MILLSPGFSFGSFERILGRQYLYLQFISYNYEHLMKRVTLTAETTVAICAGLVETLDLSYLYSANDI